MGSFANSMFSGMLSWVRSAIGWVWNTLVSTDDGGLIRWIGENWLPLIILLSAACLLTDALIHLFRWRPDKVWISFFRRLFGKKEEPGSRSGRLRRELYYADGTARTEEVELPSEEWQSRETSVEELPPLYTQTFARPEELHYQEELKKEQPLGLEDYPQPTQPLQPAPMGRRTQQLHKRMSRLNQTWADEESLDLRYRPIPPAVDKSEAYHQPYIPPQWKKPAEPGTWQEEDSHDDF